MAKKKKKKQRLNEVVELIYNLDKSFSKNKTGQKKKISIYPVGAPYWTFLEPFFE